MASELDVVVLGGGGHVGLPLSLAFAQAGLRVGIYDISQSALDRIAAGEMPFKENGADELLAELLPTGRLEMSTDGAILARTNQVVVVIGTPVDEFLGPSMTVFERAVAQISPHLREGALVVLRSTVYPGTTAYVAQHLAETRGHRRRRVLPRANRRGPRPGGAPHPAPDRRRGHRVAGDRAEALFGRLASKIIRTTSKEAELAKLFTNTWRYMKFAVANQFFMIANQAGVDYTNVLGAIRTDYPRAADLPAPGFAAGPCLFKDTMQLAAFTTDHFPLGQAAMQVNEGLPAYIVSALERRYDGLQGKTVGILGMAFKAESDDARASLSYKLRKLLAWAGATVVCTDPYVQRRPPDDAGLRPPGQRHSRSRRAPQGVPRPRRRRQGRRRCLGRARVRHPAVTSPLDAPDASRSHEATASIEADLPTIYARRFSDADAPRRGGVWRELTRFLQRYIPESAVVLDLACDRGAFINEVRAGERWAVDLRDVREHLAPGVNFVQSSGLALGEVLDAETFDVVFISNYLEHLGSADEVVEQLRVIRRLLKPGGRVVILQPNIRLVGGSYWDFLDHKTPLTEKSVVEAAQTAGLETVELIIRFLPYTTKSRFPQIPSWFGRTSPSVPRGCCSVARRCTSGADRGTPSIAAEAGDT